MIRIVKTVNSDLLGRSLSLAGSERSTRKGQTRNLVQGLLPCDSKDSCPVTESPLCDGFELQGRVSIQVVRAICQPEALSSGESSNRES